MDVKILNGYKQVIPDDGKVLAKGSEMATSVIMALDADVDWQEVDATDVPEEPTNEDKEQALLRYANEITNNNDITLGDAVKTLADGFNDK